MTIKMIFEMRIFSCRWEMLFIFFFVHVCLSYIEKKWTNCTAVVHTESKNQQGHTIQREQSIRVAQIKLHFPG